MRIEYKQDPRTEKKRIVIYQDGGLIQNIEGIPKDVVIEARDYDIDGADPEDVKLDGDGQEYTEVIWE